MRVKLDRANADIAKVIWKCKVSDTELQAERESCDKYEDTVVGAIRSLKTRIQSLTSPPIVTDNTTGVVNVAPCVTNQLKLPAVPLPEYYHNEGDNLTLFFDNFENVVGKYNLSEYEKYIFLEKQIHNAPLTLIKSLQGTNRCYSTAKQLLLSAFASDVTQKFNAISRLSTLVLRSDGDAYEFVSNVRIITELFSNLRIDVDTVMQYFVWNAMPENLKNKFVSITNVSKPTLQEINENMFTAVDRYVNEIKHKKFTVESCSGFAINLDESKVNYKKQDCNELGGDRENKFYQSCVFCSNKTKASHITSKCLRYKDPRAKVNKLKQMNYCIKCSGSHRTGSCKREFKNLCIHCNGKHFSWLCIASKSKERVNDNQSKAVCTQSASVALLQTEVSKCCALPTFTCALGTGKLIRAMKDSGSQANFITEKLIKSEKLKVINSERIKINGFNTSQPYNAKIVEVPVIIGERKVNLVAIAVPRISTSLNLNGFTEVAQAIHARGYKLADSMLLDGGDVINNRLYTRFRRLSLFTCHYQGFWIEWKICI